MQKAYVQTSKPVEEVAWLAVADRLLASASPIEFAQELGFELDPWQEAVLLTQKRRVQLCCCRQSGKSALTAINMLYRANAYEETTSLIYARALRQSAELFRKIMRSFHRIEEAMIPKDRESILRIEFDNGSRIIALPGLESTTRAYTADFIAVDEASRTPDSLFPAIRPMLAVTRGPFWLLSTPFGRSNYFARIWVEGSRETWHKVKIIAPLLDGVVLQDPTPADGICLRITKEFLEEERREMPERDFLQEYYCEFLEDEFGAFSHSDIERAMRTEEIEAWGF